MTQILPLRLGKYNCIQLPFGTRLYPICKSELSSETLSNSITWSPPEERKGVCNLSKLIQDMSEYYLSPDYEGGHSGDLMDHSLWTYYLLANETGLPKIFQPWFLQDIPPSYYPVLQVAGLLHDIGKAGDLDFEYTQKPNHPIQGWLYFQGERNYIWVDGSEIPLIEYLSANCALTLEEWSLVQIIIALHYDLGDFFEKKLSANDLIQRLNSYIKFSQIPFDQVMVFRILRAVTFADVWAQRPVLSQMSGFIQIDPNIVSKRRHPISNNNYLNEEKFALTRQLEDQIAGIQYDTCMDQIQSYTLDAKGESVKIMKSINLIIFTSENVKSLLIDPQSPYSYSIELDTPIYQSITNMNKIELRKYFIRELITEIEICSFPLAREARNEIIHWYFSVGKNKLSKKSIHNLIKRLEGYPRPDWDLDRIEMMIRRLASPNYNLENFILEYDGIYYKERIKHLKSQIQTLMTIISPLQFEDVSRPFQNWDDLIKILTQDNSFKIPLLSPKGLLILKNIFEELVCRSYQNKILNNLINYIITPTTGLFGPKYGIYGLFSIDNKVINLLSSDNFVDSNLEFSIK